MRIELATDAEVKGRLNVDSLVQLAAFKICSMGMPILAALDAPEPLVECAENESSIPASDRHFFIHLAIVEEPTAR